MLEKVRYLDWDNGIEVGAFTDGYAYDEYSHLYLISLGGRDGSVKAVSSALVGGRNIEIDSESLFEAGTDFCRKYRILSTKLPSTLLHQIVLADGFFGSSGRQEKLLFIEDEKDAARSVYELVRNNYPVPLTPEWSEWLYAKLTEKNHLEESYGTLKILKLNVDEETLDTLISEGVGSGEIGF